MFYISGQIGVRNWFLRILSLLVIMTYLLLGGWPLVVSIPDPKFVRGLFAGINFVVFMTLITIVMNDNINWDNFERNWAKKIRVSVSALDNAIAFAYLGVMLASCGFGIWFLLLVVPK